MTEKVIDVLLQKGDLGLLFLFLGAAVWFLWRQSTNQQTAMTTLSKIVENNTAANVAVAHNLDKMATEVSSSIRQSQEFNRAVLEDFARRRLSE